MSPAERHMAVAAAMLVQKGRVRSLSSGDIERLGMFVLEQRDTDHRRANLKTDIDVDRYAAGLDEQDARAMLADLLRDLSRLMAAVKGAGRLPAPGEDVVSLAIELIGQLP